MSDDELKSQSLIHSQPALMLASGSLGITASSSLGRRRHRGPLLSIDTQIADNLNLRSTADTNSPLLLICVDGREVARTKMNMSHGDTDCWHARCSFSLHLSSLLEIQVMRRVTSQHSLPEELYSIGHWAGRAVEFLAKVRLDLKVAQNADIAGGSRIALQLNIYESTMYDTSSDETNNIPFKAADPLRIASFLPKIMGGMRTRYLTGGYSSQIATRIFMHAICSPVEIHQTQSILPVDNVTPNRNSGSNQPPHVQMFNTTGLTQHAQVFNIGGDQNTYIYPDDRVDNSTREKIASIEERLKVVHDDKLDGKVQGWLSPPNVSQNLNAARRKHQATTGIWFTDGTQFSEWKDTPNIVLCIYGDPGCGKTVLCSSIIKSVAQLCESRPLSGYAYFFFDSRDSDRRLSLFENLMRSLLSQLASRCGGIPVVLEQLYHAHRDGRDEPSLESLYDALQRVIEGFDHVYIVIDSLDECGERMELLKWIETMASHDSAKVHLLFTSRLEPDIAIRLSLIPQLLHVRLQGTVLERDIGLYLDEQLSFISHWDENTRSLVKSVLMGGAGGMFRWVALQLDDLKKCLTLREVKEQLTTLPKDLEETYERILATSRRYDLLHMLHWLAFSVRALKLEELAEVVSVDLQAEDCPSYDPDMKYGDPKTALMVCSGLVTETDGMVKLAHFSVKEYLLSARIKAGQAGFFGINQSISHSMIAQTCLAYLVHFDQPHSIANYHDQPESLPLVRYAADHWLSHVRTTEGACAALHNLLLKLFSEKSNHALVNWVRLNNPDPTLISNRAFAAVAHPLYYASLLGLKTVVEHLLESGADPNIVVGGCYGTALHAAAHLYHMETVKLLLEHGARANFKEWGYATVLQVAARRDKPELVKLLLNHGADADICAGRYGSPLYEASSRGFNEVARLLLDGGADANIRTGGRDSALQIALDAGNSELVGLLLEHGADLDGTALQAASHMGSTETVLLLLEHGANVNCQGGEYGTALHAAAYAGQIGVARLLLKWGANIHHRGGKFGTVLQAARSKPGPQSLFWLPEPLQRYPEMTQFLLENGAVEDQEGV